MKNIKKFLVNEKRNILLAIAIGSLATLFLMGTKSYSKNIQRGIADELIRFHVLANSDSEIDQNLKIKVKDGVIKHLEDKLKKSRSKDETKQILQKNMDEIIDCAKQIIKENGYSYEVLAKITNTYFPTKAYGDITLPAGEYETLQLNIGSGKGQNWWCVMFPPLCFVDVTFKEVPLEDKILLENILSDEEYKIVSKSNDGDIPVKIKFKIIEFWQSFKNSSNK